MPLLTLAIRFDLSGRSVHKHISMPSSPPSLLRRYWPVGLTLAAGLAVSGGLGWKLHRDAVELDKKRMAIRIKTTFDELDGRLEKTELMLRQLQDYFNAADDISSVLLREWISKHNLPINFPWLHGVAFATNRYAKTWREAFPQPLNEWDRKDLVRLSQWGTNQPLDCQLAQTYRLRKDRVWLEDYDLSHDLAINLDALARGNLVKMSYRRPVMRGTNGILIHAAYFCLPIYDPQLPEILETSSTLRLPVQRAYYQALCRGFIIAPIDFTLLEKGIWKKTPRDLGVEIFAAKKPSAESWLNPAGDRPRATTPDFRAYLTWTNAWRMYNKGFAVFFHTTPLFDAQSPRRMAWIALGAGAAITVLASALASVSLRARGRQEQMTADVVEARDALAAAEKERERLGHDLHDGAIQSLYAIQLGLTRTSQDVQASVPSAARVLNETRERVDEVISELRRFIVSREAEENKHVAVGLDDVLAAMVVRLQPTTSAELSFHADPDASDRLSVVQVVQLTQIARTALANSLRHAQAQHVKVALQAGDGNVRLEIIDDGLGFDVDAIGEPAKAKTPNGRGMGLQTMRSRAAEAGGTLVVSSKRGEGTQIIVTIPANMVKDVKSLNG